MPRLSNEECGGGNVAAFLDMIAVSEIGRRMLDDPLSDDGYKVIVGSMPGRNERGESRLILFHDYTTHPNRLVHLTAHLSSTAAGRYQVLWRYWKAYKEQLKLPDFSPESQDRIAIKLLKETGSYGMLREGRLATALRLARSRWASLPGAGYGQHEQKIETLVAAYKAAGGNVALA